MEVGEGSGGGYDGEDRGGREDVLGEEEDGERGVKGVGEGEGG